MFDTIDKIMLEFDRRIAIQSIMRLPDELICNVLEYTIDETDQLWPLLTVCKRFGELLRLPHILQHVSLSIQSSGFVFGSIAKKRNALRKRLNVASASKVHVGKLYLSILPNLVDDDVVKAACGLSSLNFLSLGGCGCVTDNGTKDLQSLTSLKFLRLDYCRSISDKTLFHVSLMTNLRGLNISGCRVSADGIKQIAFNIPRLQFLNVSECETITDEAMDMFAKMQWLEWLLLDSCGLITDAGVCAMALSPAVSSCSRLRSVHFNNTMISDESLKALSSLPNLEELHCKGCPGVTDLGGKLFQDHKVRLFRTLYHQIKE